MFEPISKSCHIFRRQQSVTIPFESFPMRTGVGGARLEQHEPVKLSDLNQQVLLRHFDASMVLINERGDIKHFYGATRNYLEHPSGDANLNLYEMIDNRHSLMLRLAVDRAAHEQNPGKLQLAGLTRGDEAENTEVTIMPVMEPKSGGRLFAVIFEPAAARPDNPAVRALEPREGGVDIVAQLEAENQRLKQDLQVTKETFQTTHEEFTAANEEALAINEELQSTNEELETSKEELQSLNEELVTLNGQLNDKVEELGKTNDDLANFLNTSEVDTLFLDRVFSVRRFTPSATRLLNLIPSDVGRPLSHISNKLVNVDLIGIADDVLRNLGMIEKEVQSSDGLWYMLRCIPYRTLDNVIDGVVFTFTDISRLKLSEEAMMEARKYAENIIDTVRECLLILDSELKVVSANRAFYETFRVTPEETQNRLIDELGDRQWNIPRLSELLQEILQHDVTFEDFRVEHDFPKIGRKIMALNARKVSGQKPGQPRLILLAIEDVTEGTRAEAERKNLREQLFQAQKMESFGTLAAGIAHDFNNILNIIQGYASVLGPNTSKNEIAESVKVITDTSKRGASLTRQLLTLARKIEPQLESTDLNALLDELLHLLQQIFPKNIEVTLAANHKLPVITADLNQINQALLNLCVNARDAMPNGGKLTIKAKVVVGQTVQELRAGDQRYVCIEIADTGVGMGDDIQSRIFEPFFTTKNKGEGTGLGLSVAYGIITNHGGLIRVKSKPQQGTTFQVYLPVKE